MTITSGSYAPGVIAGPFSDSPWSTGEPLALLAGRPGEGRCADRPNGGGDVRRTPVVEGRLDRCPDRPARVENVGDEDDRLALEWEIERRRPHHRLRMTGRAAPANLDVVAVEGDVDRAERGLLAGPLLDQP